jgi:hypothetical protein
MIWLIILNQNKRWERNAEKLKKNKQTKETEVNKADKSVTPKKLLV